VTFAYVGITGIDVIFCLIILYHWHQMDTGQYQGHKINSKELKDDEAFEEEMHNSVRASMHDWYHEEVRFVRLWQLYY